MDDDLPGDGDSPTRDSNRGAEKVPGDGVDPVRGRARPSSGSSGEERSAASERPFEGAFAALLGGVSELSAQAVKFAARKTRDTTSKVFKNTPEQMELIGKAGTSLKDLREVAGISIEEVSKAIDLHDVDLLRSVEEGKAALPFEVLLRLSSFYARNDPIPFIMKYSRVYSPRIWKMLHAVGLDTLVVQAERELQFVQIYRSRDAARKLSEEGFNQVLDFTRKSFDMALHFVAQQELKLEEMKAKDEDPRGTASGEKTGTGKAAGSKEGGRDSKN
ncbi:MAG: helix-turn-helix transcriptional regulator [Gammaproteobacteria bacterium]|uniref:helix-turn-helix domain-containing protein n=1 Tax=Pseudomaricurvus alcaniphilus TaxID=1166482 RepID=UPI00140BC591|nr:helix-turn-helix transcriptional regulator [Pseudomaricurvus alcaniphilus]MBR9910113.1 helix-turn-helix transcriptional regulator [Gammaproteobacteria bacterium]NHN36630.1 helix-turn-helix transcriptional regulator [Pseudomaricurvus alcaniphilus]